MTRKDRRSKVTPVAKSPEAEPQNIVSWKQIALLLGCILILGLAVYSNTWNVPFQLDDKLRIVENDSIKNFSLSTFSQIWIANPKTRFLPYVSFAVNWAMAGKKVVDYHIFNLGVHVLNAFLVYFMMGLILKSPKMRGVYSRDAAFFLAAFSTLIFVAHPLQTQAVTYIVQRTASMAAFFYLGAVVLYLKARSGSGALCYSASLVMAVGAMFCKENTVTLPLAIVMVDLLFFEQKEGKWKVLLRGVPYLAIMSIALFWGGKLPGKNIIPADPESVLSRGRYFLTQLNVLCTYLRLFFFPVRQTLDYDYPVSNSLLDPKTFACALLLLGLAASGVFFLKKNRLISFSIFWFFLTLSVESSIIPIKDVIFEHRMYLPLAGFAVILPALIFFMMKNVRYAAIAGSIVVAVLSGLTYARNRVWISEISLWEDVVTKAPNKARAYNNLGMLCGEKGDLVCAEKAFENALRADPMFVMGYDNLGIIYKKRGELNKAASSFEVATMVDPNHAAAYYHLGNVKRMQGEFGKAVKSFQKASDLAPGYAYPVQELGEVYLQLGDIENVKRQIQRLRDMRYPDRAKELEGLLLESVKTQKKV